MFNLRNHEPVVSVIIPTYRQQYLADSLDALTRQQSEIPFEVIVSENGHRDLATRKCVERFNDRLLIKHIFGDRAGINLARNLGVKSASANIISLLDDDCVPDGKWIQNLIQSHRLFPAAGVIGGRTELRFLANPPGWLAGQFRHVLSEIDWSPHARELRPNEWLVGANMSFQREVYRAVGGFRDGLGMIGKDPPQLSCDESEFCSRARHHGDLIYYPRSVVEHQIPGSRLSLEYFIQRFYGQGVSNITLRTISSRSTDPASYLSDIAINLYDPSWLPMINRFGSTVARSAQPGYCLHSLRCRISQLRGMIDAARNQLSDHSIPAENRYYQFGRRAMAGARPPGATARDCLFPLWQVFESMGTRRKKTRSASEQRTILGRVAYLHGMQEAIPANTAIGSVND